MVGGGFTHDAEGSCTLYALTHTSLSPRPRLRLLARRTNICTLSTHIHNNYTTFLIFNSIHHLGSLRLRTVRGQFSSLHIFNSLYHCVYVTQPPLSNA